MSVEELLTQLARNPGPASIPVLVVTGQREPLAHLKATGRVAAVLRKPVSGVQLRESVDTLLAAPPPPDTAVLRRDRARQRQLILDLIARGPEGLVLQISRRLCVDRLQGPHPREGVPLTWAEIADWGYREGLVDAEHAQLLGRISAHAVSDARGGGHEG